MNFAVRVADFEQLSTLLSRLVQRAECDRGEAAGVGEYRPWTSVAIRA